MEVHYPPQKPRQSISKKKTTKDESNDAVAIKAHLVTRDLFLAK